MTPADDTETHVVVQFRKRGEEGETRVPRNGMSGLVDLAKPDHAQRLRYLRFGIQQ